jgi:hypothetical protein
MPTLVTHQSRANQRARAGYVAWLLAVLTALALPLAASGEQYRWSGVERVVAISDPHGAYEALLKTLQNAAVIDDNGQWAGGKTHLVITGDLLDRGADSRKVMDLVMALESQAPESGGMVHLTLGNHEVMNLVGDLRYVAAGEYAAFADDESPAERERWFEIFRAGRAGEDEAALRAEFADSRPAGFYAHRRALRSDGHYGSWLLSRPVMVLINDTVYVHGGLPPLVADYDLRGLNAELQSQVAEYVRQAEVLYDAGLLDPAVNFYGHPDAAEAIAANAMPGSAAHTAAAGVIELSGASIHGSQSPLWYRGTVGCSTLLEDDTLTAALHALGATRAVIGHTPTLTRQVLTRHGGRVTEIDTGMLNAAYRGSGFALILEGNNAIVVGEKSPQPAAPAEHPRRVGVRPHDMTPAALEEMLQSGEIGSINRNAAGQEIVEVTSGATTIAALFTLNSRNGVFSPPLATYRLDRLLGLDMVPVTVARTIDGKSGALQFYPNDTRDEGDRAANGAGGDAWCSLQKQWNAMYIFDALIYNQGRPQSGMLYSRDNYQLILSGNENTFASKRGKPKYLEQAPLIFSASWIAALASLSDELLAEKLGEILDKRRLGALEKRRDLLLQEAQAR